MTKASAKTPPQKATAPRMSEGQMAYEARRAAKAGMSTEKWLDAKRRAEAQAEASAERARRDATAVAKPPGLLKRLLDRAHKPL